VGLAMPIEAGNTGEQFAQIVQASEVDWVIRESGS
jgi:hypothetical protein